MSGFLGLIGLFLVFAIPFAMNKAHRESTGVPMPSRGAMRGIRRRGRKMGISERQAYEEWLARKQRTLARAAKKLPQEPTVAPSAVPAQTAPVSTSPAGGNKLKLTVGAIALTVISALWWGLTKHSPSGASGRAPPDIAPQAVSPPEVPPSSQGLGVPLPRPRPRPFAKPLNLAPPGVR